MRANRTAFVIAALMCAASIGAVVARPDTKVASREPTPSLETIIPKHFGDWREEPQRIVRIVSPKARALLDKLYAKVLTRTYMNAYGYRIMLSVAYGSDQRDSLQAHEPELCYVAQGFTLHRTEASQLATMFGDIPVRRMFASKGVRQESVTYWLTFGDNALLGDKAGKRFQRRLVELRYRFTGRIPDGLLFRVSSIDPDQTRAYQLHDQFTNQLLQAVSSTGRKRLTGLGDS